MTKKEFIALFGKPLWIWLQQHWVIVLLVLFLIVQYIVSLYVKKRLANTYKYTNQNDPNDEWYIRYYQKLQLFEFVRLVFIVWSILYTLAVYQSWFFSVFAVALWTIIITFQTMILSFGVYFYLVSNYRAWDAIRVWNLWQWEIIYIKPFYMSISLKSDEWEHVWELLIIPNNQVRWQPITRVNLSLSAYTKQTIKVVYDMKTMDIWFDEFIRLLEQFLDSYLPKISRKAYKNFKTYHGLKYKLNYDMWEYRDSRQLIDIEIKLITSIVDTVRHKKAIISFLDSLLKDNSRKKSVIPLKSDNSLQV